MGRKSKSGYNSEARKVIKGDLVDKDAVKKLREKVVLNEDVKNEDDSNALVLPSKKRQFKKAKEGQNHVKLLSKKRRKHLEKIVEQKKKKAERGELLQKLKEVQIDAEVLNKMTSLSQVQTKGIKN